MAKTIKEVSDRVVVILIVIAVVVSIIGTYLVYTKASNVRTQGDSAFSPQPGDSGSDGQVTVYVVNEKGESEEGGK